MPKTQRDDAVLITGTSSGIGKETALHLDRLGLRVFATVRKQPDAVALSSQASESLCPIILDVTDQGSIDLARNQVAHSIGEEGLTGLVNNAGVGFTAPLEFVPLQDLRWLFEVNVFGVLAVTQAFLPLLRQTRDRIVNVSSTAALLVAPFYGRYSASKLSLNGLSNAFRLELGPRACESRLLSAAA
jgi:NAD(P)-dependent dehydrogenase (short-subunit alcohol dehydrogenase family)